VVAVGFALGHVVAIGLLLDDTIVGGKVDAEGGLVGDIVGDIVTLSVVGNTVED
jgi:hypothetical protein